MAPGRGGGLGENKIQYSCLKLETDLDQYTVC